MHKKLITACMAIAAFAAFVVAPAASASPELTSNGVTIPVGTSITGKLTGHADFKGGFNVTCTNAHIVGTVTENTGTSAKGTVPVGGAVFNNGPGVPCTSGLGNTTVVVTSELCLQSIKGVDQFSITGCTGVVTFDLTAAGITCKYEASTITGTYETNKSPTPVTLNGAKATEEGHEKFFCPNEGELFMTFDLYTTDGTPVTVS